MKTNKLLLGVFTLSAALAAAPAFAQGVGVGVGVGGQTKVGVGAGAGAQGPPANVGVRTNTEAQAKTRADVKAGGSQAKSAARSTADIAGRIESNANLAARVRSMLPSGTSISTASAGFKNEGQFLAALHASQNLTIPFNDLKAKMTGSTAMSLGSAIQASKPDMKENEAMEAAKQAEAAAKASASAKADANTAAETKASTNPPPKSSGKQ